MSTSGARACLPSIGTLTDRWTSTSHDLNRQVTLTHILSLPRLPAIVRYFADQYLTNTHASI